MRKEINILHLSDLHFGDINQDRNPTIYAKRNIALKQLSKCLKKLSNDWTPHKVVISGDISWSGSENDFNKAKKWITNLLTLLNLSPLDLFICPGNHDVNRKLYKNRNIPKSASKSDEELKIENLSQFKEPFKYYIEFYNDLGIPLLKFGNFESQLSGFRGCEDLNFIVLNSAWYCSGEDSKEKLWIGLPQLKVLESEGLLPNGTNLDNKITIAILHHPQSYLAEDELYSSGDRPATYHYLAERCHLILSGHSHTSIMDPDRISNSAFCFKGGATYSEDNYRYNFSIYKINIQDYSLERKAFEFDPRLDKWKDYPLDKNKKINIESSNLSDHKKKSITLDYSELLKNIKKNAQKYIEYKSCFIAKTKSLPKIIQRRVVFHGMEEKVSLRNGNRILNTQRCIVPMSDVFSASKPTFLFGEIGSGKSTLVGSYIIELTKKANIIPILIPARFFIGQTIKTVIDLFNSISLYVNEHIDITQSKFHLQEMLQDGNEVFVIIDGFDELNIQIAQNLVLMIENTVHQFSNLRTICTGRPIELRQLNYSNWQCLEMASLSTEEQRQLLINEALADGMDEESARTDANSRMMILKLNPALLSISTTPLNVRLLRPFLTQSNLKKSFGDLLVDVLYEHLGFWGERNGKLKEFKTFKQYFPHPFSCESLIGEIAAVIYNSPTKSITEDSLFSVIESSIEHHKDNRIIVSQACDFFKKNILVKESDRLYFISQPLFQVAIAFYINHHLIYNKRIDLHGDKVDLWREYSFVATIMRRKNQTKKLYPKLEKYINEIFTDINISPAIATIISESYSEELAKQFIQKLDDLEFRPLRDFIDLKTGSAPTYAHILHLAGDIGFNWFFNHYLDPKFPPHDSLHSLDSLILGHWILISDFKVKNEYLTKLKTIIKPLIFTQSFNCSTLLPIIAIILPNEFDIKHRTRLLATLLKSPLFKMKASQMLINEFKNGSENAVLEALETECINESPKDSDPARLWLQLSKGKPPLNLIQHIILLSIDKQNTLLYSELENRIGSENLISVLKLYLFYNSKVSAAAAVKLAEHDETNLYLLGPGLLKGLHDGGKIEEAETILHDLIHHEGLQGILWLINQFPDADGIFGPHSAYWRILLTELISVNRSITKRFIYVIQYLGMIILPRYPEIRKMFKELFNKKPEYRQELYSALKSLNRKLRYFAACLLVTCFPETEKQATEIFIKGIDCYGISKSDEMIYFSYRLAFGEDIIKHIASFVDSLISNTRTFALAILFHNNFNLNENQFEYLILDLLRKRYLFDRNTKNYFELNLPNILAHDDAFNLLIKRISDNNQLSKNAALALLRHHKKKLTSKQLVKCLTLNLLDIDRRSLRQMDEEVIHLDRNIQLKKIVSKISLRIKSSTGKEPPLNIYLRTFSDVSAWGDMLWTILFQQGFFPLDLSGSFFWIYQKCRENTKIAEAIGSAAINFLNDPRSSTSQPCNDSILWLALYAHEFSNLSSKKISELLQQYKAIDTEIITSLVARLGDDTNLNISIGGKEYLTIFKQYSKIEVGNPQLKDILDILKLSETLHPKFHEWVERVLLSESLTDIEINEAASFGKFGVFFSLLILFCRKSEINFDWFVQIIQDPIVRIERHKKNESLDLLENFKNVLHKITIHNSNFLLTYLKHIRKNIKNGSNKNPVILISELFNYSNKIKTDIFSIFLNEISEHPYRLNITISKRFVKYLLRLSKKEKSSVLLQVKKIISSLSSQPEKVNFKIKGLAELLFSLTVFYLQGNKDEDSERVFIYGLQSIFINQDEESNEFPVEPILMIIEPLLAEIPHGIISQVIQTGLRSDVPGISSFCRLLDSITR